MEVAQDVFFVEGSPTIPTSGHFHKFSIYNQLPPDYRHYSQLPPQLNMNSIGLIILGVAALVMSTSAQYGQGGYEEQQDEHKDYYSPPHYAYEYKVHDSHTGDVKSAHETREGDVVKGFYSLAEADGTVREVHYTADHKNGFNAEVKKIGHAHHAPAPVHAPSPYKY